MHGIGLFLHSNARGEEDTRLVISPERTGDGDLARHLSVGLLCEALACLPSWASGRLTDVVLLLCRVKLGGELERGQAIMHQWEAFIYSTMSPEVKNPVQLAKAPF